jgi:hypothetical protein
MQLAIDVAVYCIKCFEEVFESSGPSINSGPSTAGHQRAISGPSTSSERPEIFVDKGELFYTSKAH